jgi:hypothetical protein
MGRIKTKQFKAGSKHLISTGNITIMAVKNVVMYKVLNEKTNEGALMSHDSLCKLIKNSTLAISKTKTDE